MSKLLDKEIQSMVKLANGEQLAIANKDNKQEVILLDKDNSIINEFNQKDNIAFAYSFTPTHDAEGIFWINNNTYNVEKESSETFLKFIRLLKSFVND